jgi:pimeloyl-ACP methyl ester carboxylesterase
MALTGYPVPVTDHTVRANGIDLHYVEAGEGIPLILLHGGAASNSPLWVNHPAGWPRYLDLFAQHFRVILPDTRGHGRTRNPSGKLSYPLYAQDYLAFIQALGLDHPFIGGMSDGGRIATLIGIMAPEVPRALVDWAGYQMLNPDQDAWVYHFNRELLGGSPDATQADYDGLVSRGLNLQLRIDDFEPAQGQGYMRTYFEQVFPFWTRPMEYTFADYPRITTPMLMMFGDRDPDVRLVEAYEVLQQLPRGEFGVIPGVKHELSLVGCGMMLDYLQRHREYREYSR